MTAIPPLVRSLLDALREPALLLDGERLAAANAAARAVLGQAIEGRDVRFAIRHPDALELLLGSAREGELDFIGIGGAERPWRLSLRPLGDRNMRLALLTDRTEALAADRLRVDFVANASHELRTPLATIIGYGETLAEDAPLDEPLRRRFGATLLGEARRMLRLIEELMSLSRIEAERFRAPGSAIDLADIARTAVADSALLAERRGIALSLEVEPGVAPVAGDPVLLGRVVTNLIDNAIRHGCNDSSCAVRVTLGADPAGVRLAVRDDGDGIAAEHLPRLTQRFYRVDPARSRDGGGTGLGLAIVKHIVERHRGRLDISSSVGEGTEVAITLPISRSLSSI